MEDKFLIKKKIKEILDFVDRYPSIKDTISIHTNISFREVMEEVIKKLEEKED